jgi:hypothetical protein
LSFSQTFERELNLIPVFDGEGLLQNIYSGGHNNIEHQFVDIDGDDDLDIFYLDSDQTFGWYENIGDKFNAGFELKLNNPVGLSFSNWFYFVDIDADNDFDYFTGNVDQISFYRNDGNFNSPSFTLVQDTVWDNEGQPIFGEFDSNHILVDIDADNDYDLIMGSTAGSLTYYENIGTPQQFNLKHITDVWQNIIIIGGDFDNTLHGASSVDFVDIDADNDLDLFWGDFFSKSLYFIENQGTATNPNMQLVSNIYPMNSDSVNTSGFNMPRFADIDADNDYDLFVSVLYNSTVPQSLIFYENSGDSVAAFHQLVTPNYIKTLDVRNNSIPSFVDIDNDNDNDLFLGSLDNPLGTVHFLKNIGTTNDPLFSYLDSSFFGIEKDLSTSPTFGDLDGDGDYDLLVGKFNGEIDIYLNSGSPNTPQFSNGQAIQNNQGSVIDVGTSAVPFLIDIDNDLDMDLAIGGFNGKFEFYFNIGSTQSYSFQKDTFYFAIGTTPLDVGDFSTPFLIDFNQDGAFDLFSGNRNGKFYHFKNEGSNLSPVWNEITDLFINERFGGNTAPYFADIDNDSDIDLLLGNLKGGLYLYNNIEVSIVAEWEVKPVENFTLNSYPNPFNPTVNIVLNTSTGETITIDVFNILGEKVKSLFKGFIPPGIRTLQWNGRNNSGSILPSGTYFVLARSENQNQVIKISFLK